MVKKISFVVAFILISISCGACSTNLKEKDRKQGIEVDENYVFDVEKIKKSGEGIYKGEIIVDETSALKYSNIILTQVLKDDIIDDYEARVQYDSNNQTWVVSYFQKETLGGDINIAIDKKTGEILLVWFGE